MQLPLQDFGLIPASDSKFKRRIRIHQGWWRHAVLREEAGFHPLDKNKRVCNTVLDGKQNPRLNFLTDNTVEIVKGILTQRDGNNKQGIIEEERLFNNLLSSQPLCFNFFAELACDKAFGLKVLQIWWEGITELKEVYFEYAPKENYTNDSSAFDVAFEVKIGDQNALIGLECKYTDSFSYRPSKSKVNYGAKGSKNHEVYQSIFNAAQQKYTLAYEDYVNHKDYNQLFRNQLIAEALLQNQKYDQVYTGLFCYEGDNKAIDAGEGLCNSLKDQNSFTVLTYRDFISKVQRLDLSWEQREWTMLLWGRYCGLGLSKNIVDFFIL